MRVAGPVLRIQSLERGRHRRRHREPRLRRGNRNHKADATALRQSWQLLMAERRPLTLRAVEMTLPWRYHDTMLSLLRTKAGWTAGATRARHAWRAGLRAALDLALPPLCPS